MIDLEKTKSVLGEFQQYKSDPLALYTHCKQAKINVSQYLEKLDPTGFDSEGKPAQEVDAFTRHLMSLDIKVSGMSALTVEQLQNAAEYLMPEIVRREILAGMNVADQFSYKDCVAVTTPSNTIHYHPLYIPNLNLASNATRRDKSLGARASAGKGGEFPRLSIISREKDVVMVDIGRTIEADYAVVKNYGWEEFAVLLRLIGASLAADKLQNVYDLCITGDGTVGAATNTFGGVAGTLAYTDLIDLFTNFESPFCGTRILAPVQTVQTIMSMAQFQDPFAGWQYQKTGQFVTPMGAKLKQVRTVPGATPVGTVFGTIDHNYAVKEVINQEFEVEANKIIERKFEQAVASERSKLCIIADGALRRTIWT